MRDYEQDERKESKLARKIASRVDRSQYKKTDLIKKNKRRALEEEKKISINPELVRGRVLSIVSGKIIVQYENRDYMCTLRGVLKKNTTQDKNLVVIGDFVLFTIGQDYEGSIAHVEKRRSVLLRQEHLRRRQKQLIAANIDQVLITASVVEPQLKIALIDRYIIAARKGNLEPIILINKIDLLDGKSKEELEEFLKIYRGLGFCVITLSINTGEGIDLLKEQMRGKSSVFSGQSGVGKSSLINAMTGSTLPVGEVIKKTRKGMHTTSQAHLVPLEFGGFCIDTPGIKSFGIWDLQRQDLDRHFSEIYEKSSLCKYPNCTHFHEPGCAVKEAVERQEISLVRLLSYIKLFDCLRDL